MECSGTGAAESPSARMGAARILVVWFAGALHPTAQLAHGSSGGIRCSGLGVNVRAAEYDLP